LVHFVLDIPKLAVLVTLPSVVLILAPPPPLVLTMKMLMAFFGTFFLIAL
jgi:hypothetical protein